MMAAAVVLVGAAGRIAATHRAAEETRAGLAQRRTELVARLQHAESELAAANRSSAELAALPGDPGPAKVPPRPRAMREENPLQKLLEDPKLQVLWFAQQRAELGRGYGPFFRAQQLSPAQVERLSDLIIQSQMQKHDLSEIRRTGGVPFNDPGMTAQRDRGAAELKAGVVAVLGEEGYAKLEDYTRALDVRIFVAKVAGDAAVEGKPISREQAEALVQVLANATPNYAQGGRADLGRIDWAKAEEQALNVLTPAQGQILRTDNLMLGGSNRRAIELITAVSRAGEAMVAAGNVPKS